MKISQFIHFSVQIRAICVIVLTENTYFFKQSV